MPLVGLVVTALRAGVVRPRALATVTAGNESYPDKGVVRTAHEGAGMRFTSFWVRHQPILINTGKQRSLLEKAIQLLCQGRPRGSVVARSAVARVVV